VTECLFFKSRGPFTDEHIIPAALGNDDLILTDEVCSKCNKHFGDKVERPLLEKSPIAFWRVYLSLQNRDGDIPAADLSQPGTDKGLWKSTHPAHDNGLTFGRDDMDGSLFVGIEDPMIVDQILRRGRTHFQFVVTPKALFDLGRFLCKVGVELLCLDDRSFAREPRFDDARGYARQGSSNEFWPVFHFSSGSIGAISRTIEADPENEGELLETIECYRYSLTKIEEFVLVVFGIGTDNWVACLNDRYPTPIIRNAFPGVTLDLVWYSREQI
jgi:hypothetical protein